MKKTGMPARIFAVLLALGLFAAPLVAEAQQAGKLYRIGYLISGSPAANANRVEALRIGLRNLGYVEGKNMALVVRSAARADQLPDVAADLVRLNVDVIFATSSTEVEAARRATHSPRMPTPSVSATWPALRNPAATSRGCRWSSPSSWPRNSRS
jgi:putative ABC transport system substrate-binding protein